jgi:hypothetical protein
VKLPSVFATIHGALSQLAGTTEPIFPGEFSIKASSEKCGSAPRVIVKTRKNAVSKTIPTARLFI